MRKYAAATVIILVSILACKNKKKADAANVSARTEAGVFFEAYKKLKLPFSVTDTNITQVADTNSISYPIFTQFVPDSIFNNPFGKNRKLSIDPIGKIEQKGKETYFVTLVSDKKDSAIYVSVYDKKKIAASMPLVVSGNDDNSINSASIDPKLSIVLKKEWTVKNERFYKRTIYAYNNTGIFTTVLTETNEDRNAASGVLNPLDTFPVKFKYSGDYAKGRKNFLFIRDGKEQGEYLFFVHFESESKDDECGGELKGSLKMVSDKAGIYTGNGDACVLNISFAANTAKVKETGSCGNYRGIKCFFNDTYTKKKESKALVKKK